MTTTLAEYQATDKIFALLRPEGGGLLLFRPWHITLDGYRVRAVPGAVTPLAEPAGEWTHQIALDTRHGPRVLRLTTEAAAVAALAIERWTAAAEKRRKQARRKKSTDPDDSPTIAVDVCAGRTHKKGAGETAGRKLDETMPFRSDMTMAELNAWMKDIVAAWEADEITDASYEAAGQMYNGRARELRGE